MMKLLQQQQQRVRRLLFGYALVCCCIAASATTTAFHHHAALLFRSNSKTKTTTSTSITRVAAQNENNNIHDNSNNVDRRTFGVTSWGALVSGAGILTSSSSNSAAHAQVFFDPAQYGDQELRVGAVDSVREAVRRAILRNPQLAPSFYQLALLDGLSYNPKTKAFGPDGKVLLSVLTSKQKDLYTQNLQEACLALVDAEKALRKKTAITLADAIAIGGAEAIESIGGPILPVQLGRADTPKDGILPSLPPLDLFAGTKSTSDIAAAFASAGLTEREMTALLAGLLTLEKVEKTRSTDDWKQSAKPKFREPGKMGRMSDFKQLTDEDIATALAQAELDDEEGEPDPDDGWYIADSFGTRDDRFGQRLGKEEINEKNFNKYIKEVDALYKKKGDVMEYGGWTASILVDPTIPTAQTWITKYAGTNLAFIKDLALSYNALTQLGAVYTGGRYADLLQNRKRKSLNDDGLDLF